MLHQGAPVESPLMSSTTTGAATWLNDADNLPNYSSPTTTVSTDNPTNPSYSNPNINNVRYMRLSQLDIRVLIITASFLILLLTILLINCILRILFRRLLHTTDLYYNNTKIDSAPAGMTRAQIRSLPAATFLNPCHVAATPAPTSDQTLLQEAASQSTCPICLQSFRHLDHFRVLPGCRHSFHVACIDTWLAKHSSCPTCRRHLTATSPHIAHPRCLYLHFVIPVITSTRQHYSSTHIPPNVSSNNNSPNASNANVPPQQQQLV